jgi:hypothetical protein
MTLRRPPRTRRDSYNPRDAHMNLFVEVVGWIAALLILAAYWLVSTNRVDGRSRLYQAMNVVGAAGLVLNGGWNGAFPSATLNVIWMGIGLYALWKSTRVNA